MSDIFPDWSEALTRFEAHLQRDGLAPNTVTGYRRDVQSLSLWLDQHTAGQVLPFTFSAGDVEAFRQHLHVALGRSPSSINRCLQSVRRFGRFVVDEGLRGSNPAQAVPLLAGEGPGVLRTLDSSERQRLLAAAEARSARTARRDRALLLLLLETGMRVGELVDLRLDDLSLLEDQGTVLVRGQRKRRHRRLPLGPDLERALQAYLREPRAGGSSWLFLSREGKALAVRSVQQVVAALGRAAGLDVSTRLLRDTYARTLWQDTGDILLLTERLGYLRPEAAFKHVYSIAVAGSTAQVSVPL